MPNCPSQLSNDGGEGEDDNPPASTSTLPSAHSPIEPPNPTLPASPPVHNDPPLSPPPLATNAPRKLRDRGGGSLNVNQLMRKQMEWSIPKAADHAPLLTHPIDNRSEVTPPPDSDQEPDDDDGMQDAAKACRAGLDFVYTGQYDDYLSHEEALQYAFDTSEHALKVLSSSTEPRSYAEAMLRPPEERAHWHGAAVQEIEALHQENPLFKTCDNLVGLG
ncbi:hypothetical protein B0H11DRAFT_2233972 [Mycena galericulata]|nr:hypothetical protein B0H11DRAFT_2233972 [Mycena galericulata]